MKHYQMFQATGPRTYRYVVGRNENIDASEHPDPAKYSQEYCLDPIESQPIQSMDISNTEDEDEEISGSGSSPTDSPTDSPIDPPNDGNDIQINAQAPVNANNVNLFGLDPALAEWSDRIIPSSNALNANQNQSNENKSNEKAPNFDDLYKMIAGMQKQLQQQTDMISKQTEIISKLSKRMYIYITRFRI